MSSPVPSETVARVPHEQPLLVKMALGVSVAALIVAMIAMGSARASVPVATSGPAQSAAVNELTGQTLVDVALGEMFVRPSSIEVPAGSEVVLTVTNEGTMDHDLKLQGGETGTRMLRPGESETVSLGIIKEATEAWCTVAGHQAAGMSMAITVAKGESPQPTSTETATGDMSPAGANPAAASIDPAAKPGPEWTAYDPTLRPAPGGTEHAITLEAIDKVVEVSPGVRQLLWTFGGVVPGPTLRGKVGDVFTVTLVNKGTIGHSLDFHAGRTPMDEVMRTIAPGESLVYQFTAEHSGIWMYHCGTPPVLHHIGNGMFGAVIIDPPSLAPVDREFVVVQSELYLGAPEREMDLAKMAADSPDAVVFNGYDRQYAFAPIEVPVGKPVRIWVLDAGPSQPSSFHVIGTQFDTVFKEGAYLLRAGNKEKGGAQVLDLLPGSGGFVEMTFPKAGHYAFVSHRFVDANRGALGTIVAN